jgi:hypothetical protein
LTKHYSIFAGGTNADLMYPPAREAGLIKPLP